MYESSSVWMARLLGLLYLSVAAGGFIRKDYFHAVLKDFSNHPGLTFFSGFLALLTGGVMIHLHNEWQAGWPVLITLVGWAALLKGILLLACPGTIRNISTWMLMKPWVDPIPWLCAALGLLFLYCGFFA